MSNAPNRTDEDFDRLFADLTKAIAAIRAANPDVRQPHPNEDPMVRAMLPAGTGADVGGYIDPCPVCGTGRLGYRISRYNSHIAARCSTPTCVTFRE